MKQILVLLFVLFATSCVGVLCSPSPSSQEDAPVVSTTATRKLPALFDFEQYQLNFGKNYGSKLEATTRRIYFLAKAFLVYTYGVAYKFWKRSSYLALNSMSDMSPKELDMMENKEMIRASSATDGAKKTTDKGQAASPENVANYQEQAPESVASHLEAAIMQSLQNARLENAYDEKAAAETEGEPRGESSSRKVRRRRQKRNAEKRHRQSRPPRHLTMEQLVKRNQQATEPPEVLAKLDPNPESNNPDYDALEVMAMTMGLVDQQEQLRFWRLSPPDAPETKSNGPKPQENSPIWGTIVSVIANQLKNLIDEELGTSLSKDQEEEEALPDEMFADLRKSGCMFQPRDQGTCGSCYAFAAITMAEWLYCKKRGKLVAFSEQYMVDCGKGRFEGMNGCSGGDVQAVPNFIHNFGLELLHHYPYMMAESVCPYPEDTDLKKTGFIRMELGDATQVPIELWPQALEHGPLFVGLAVPPNFDHYGGGIETDCGEKIGHAMVLVGHGRENGQEFWLIRNSYGADWGEEGYFKLAKSVSAKKCFLSQRGWTYGTKDGRNFAQVPTLNIRNNNAYQHLRKEMFFNGRAILDFI